MYRELSTTPYQRSHIETIIGAGIWYIPNKKLWTGFVSLQAILEHHPDSDNVKSKLTEDHRYPRKVAARRLLETDWLIFADPVTEITRLFIEKYGTFNLVTPAENRRLMKFQKVDVFISPQDSYASANIRLVKLSKAQLKLLKQRDRDTVDAVISLAGSSI